MFVSNQAAATVEACVDGLGFGLFLSYQVHRQIDSGELKVVLEEYETDVLDVQLLFSETRLLATRVRRFIELVTRNFENGLPVRSTGLI